MGVICRLYNVSCLHGNTSAEDVREKSPLERGQIQSRLVIGSGVCLMSVDGGLSPVFKELPGR